MDLARSASKRSQRSQRSNRSGSAVVGPGSVVGARYRLVQSLGRGGMGEVFKALDEQTQREVALKRFRLDLEQHEDLLRFRREFHTLARLRHPRIVEAYDFGIEDGRPFYTMELLDGQDFGDLAPLPWPRACALLRDIASALAFLHARRLLHRDIAPRNARCTADGRAKLLDFGMLATMGSTTEIVGTVHSIAPEMILGFPMDGRADLFGFGALAFWLLTGRHPRRARNLADLVREGHTRAPRPSSIEASVPVELDELVLSLLSHEPLGRPASAAEVIDRLGAIGSLPPAHELEVVRGYVRSADLVGRKHELEAVRKRLMRAMSGNGGTIVVEARSGMGKTRLLHEIELEAKLAGALVLRAQAQIGGPYALLRQLGLDRGILTSGDDHLAEHSVIDRLLRAETDGEPDTGATLLVQTQAKTGKAAGNDLREERLELQSALGERIAALAERRPLVVVIDDLQRADEGSAAALASLAYEARQKRILLVCALRSDERIGARRAVAKIREHATVLHPSGLGSAELEHLLRSMFGDVPNLARLAGWLRRQAGGSPLHCIEIVRDLVDRGVLREEGGAWTIPERFTDEGLPRGLAEAMDARVRGLPEEARALGRVLSVHGGWVPLAVCVALATGRAEEDVFAALAVLEREDILVGAGERWALRHEGLREAFLRDIDTVERARLELLVGRTLLELGPVPPEREAAVGWHLLRGGERLRGARMLARAGKRLFEATSFADAIAPLSAALDVYAETRSNPYTRVRLVDMLHTAGFYSDRETAVRHRDANIELLARFSGLRVARKLHRVGWRLAVLLGLCWAFVVYLFRGSGRRGPAPVLALRMYMRAVIYAAGVAGFSFDTATLRRCLALLEPLTFSRRPVVVNAIRFVGNLLAFNLGRLGTIQRQSTDELAAFLNEQGIYTIAERRLVVGGAMFQRGLSAVRTGSPDALGEIAALDRLDTRLWSMGALQLRSHYHLWRGEDDEARRVWSEAELEFVRLGSLWQLDAVHHASACVTAAFVGDGLGLKRHIEVLARQVAAGMNYRGHLDLARGEYAKLRGDLDGALRAIDAALAELPSGEGLVRPWALVAKAETLLGLGDLGGAMAFSREAVKVTSDPEYGQLTFWYRALRVLALCESKAGDHEVAAARLDGAIDSAESIDNPLVLGMLHEARVQVALAAGNDIAAVTHAQKVEFWFRPTRNPVLIARWERIERVLQPPPDPNAEVSANDVVTEMLGQETAHHDTIAEALSVLSDCRTANARAQRALELLVESAGARGGLLYVARHGHLALAAPGHGTEPPVELADAATERFDRVQESPDTVSLELEAIDGAPSSGWATSVLACTRAGRTTLVGVVLLRMGERALEQPNEALVEAIAHRLADDAEAAAGSVSVSAP